MTSVLRRVVLVAILGLFIVGSAWAQDGQQEQEAQATQGATEASDDAAEAPQDEAFSEAITVMAQKREQALKDVPISVTVLPSEMLEELAITDTFRLENVTPNLRVNAAFGAYAPQYSIRGVGEQADDQEISSSPVAIHINEVASAFPVATTGQLFDLEQVEVLRGPQGDLFGLNTTGGTINMVTAKPTPQYASSLYAEFGRYETAKLDAFVSGPLSEKWWGRVAASTTQRGEGWQRHAETGEKNGEIDKGGLRASLRYIGETTFADIELHTGWEDSDVLAGHLTNQIFHVFEFPIDPPGGPLTDVLWSDIPPLAVPNANRPFNDGESFGGTAKFDWTFDSVSLASVTGFQQYDRFAWVDTDGSTFRDGDNVRDTDIESFSQELRLSSTSGDGAFWLAGINYADDTVENRYIFDEPDNPLFPAVGENDISQDREVFAIFGHAEWDLGPDWRFAVGARYTEETRDILNDGTKLNADPLGAFPVYQPGDVLTGSIVPCLFTVIFGLPLDCEPGSPFASSIKDDDFSGKLTLTNRASDAWTWYVSAARGFKSGGFNGSAASIVEQFKPFGPETVDAFEVGFKGVFNNGLTWNTSLFHYDYQDQQVFDSLVDPFFGPLIAIVNAPESEIQGFESELMWSNNSVTVTQALGYNSGEFKEFIGVNDVAVLNQQFEPDFLGFTPVLEDLAGQDIGFPEWQYSGTLLVEKPAGGDKVVRWSLDYSYEDESSVTGEFGLPDYWLVNSRLSLALNDAVEVGLYARNLLDEEYLNFHGFFNQGIVKITGEPATYGLTVRFSK